MKKNELDHHTLLMLWSDEIKQNAVTIPISRTSQHFQFLSSRRREPVITQQPVQRKYATSVPFRGNIGRYMCSFRTRCAFVFLLEGLIKEPKCQGLNDNNTINEQKHNTIQNN